MVAEVSAPSDPGKLSREAADIRREVHEILRQANYDYERLQYNTVVSAGMKLLNTLERVPHPDSTDADMRAVLREGLSITLRVLYPVVPHIGHVLWRELGFEAAQGDLLDVHWPEVDEAALVRDVVSLVLQINGKVRGQIEVAAEAEKSAIEATALASEAFERHGQGKPVRKVIVVPGKLVNLVV